MLKSVLLFVGASLLIALLAFKLDPPLTTMQRELLCDVTVLMLIIAALCFVVGELTRNFSQVDKLWSIVPVLYAWVATVKGGMEPRMVLMASVATVWGIRLTYNFSRHGGYSWKFWTGNEDYRWAHVRKKPGLGNPVVWALFDLGFISLYQNALLLAIALPIVMVYGTGAPGVVDYTLAALFVGLVVMETVADQQQWNFQADKKRQLKAGGALSGMAADGFISSGLWSRSRHPNYFAEQSIWVVFFLFSVAATGRLNWSIAGCLFLILLFRASANLSESIQLVKYPRYSDYQRRVPRFLPRLF
jgi:steroid 5-alpha reductase family enzyme